ncbi:MAG TPA: RNA polymerase sigma factor [Terriglobia bacterium]|nr:RNA polymerase sigma factor [Terriglobia bacterium]
MNSARAMPVESVADFEAIARDCRPFLLQIAISSTHNADDAEDIVQEALARGFRGIKRFRGDCPVRIWLARIVVRVSINHHRSLARRLKRWVFFADMEYEGADGSVTQFDPPDTAHEPRARERMLDVNKQVNRLPDEFRMPLLMLAVDGMTIPEIAEILQIPPGTVKSRIFYARKRLKDALRDRRTL